MSKIFHILPTFIFLSFIFSSSTHAQAVGSCGTLYSPGQYGPYDYRNQRDKLPIVEGTHFTPVIEALLRGAHEQHPGSDIDYTLRAIPNNHRALLAMMRLGERDKTQKPRGSRYSIDCWFQRAIQFRPDDGIVRMIYSTYLGNNDRTSEANSQLDIATAYAKDNAFTHYNIGLHYFDIKNYHKANLQANKAMALGFQSTDLRDRLREIGKWIDSSESSEKSIK